MAKKKAAVKRPAKPSAEKILATMEASISFLSTRIDAFEEDHYIYTIDAAPRIAIAKTVREEVTAMRDQFNRELEIRDIEVVRTRDRLYALEQQAKTGLLRKLWNWLYWNVKA